MASRKIGVVVVNWNAGGLLAECIAAVRKQTVCPDRIVVVDNGSTDDSLREVEEDRKGVEVVRLGRNAGFAEANNIAVRTIDDCRWVVLLNPDAFPAPDCLEKLLAAAARYPDCSFFGGLLLKSEDPRRVDGTGDVYHVSGAHWRGSHGKVLSERDRVPGEIFAPCAAAALYRRDAFLEVGGFDESFFCYAEDIDLGFRLRLAGHRCRFVPDAVVYHVGSAITGRRSDFTVYHAHRNLVWAYVKNMPGPLFWLYLPQHLLLNLVSILWYGLRGRGRVILRSKRDAIKGLATIWRQRKVIQKKTKVGAWELRRLMARRLLMPYTRLIGEGLERIQ